VQPGQTVAIAGMIEVDFNVEVRTPDVTFDCAEPGSGVSAAPDIGLYLFIVTAPDVTVQHLVIDARNGSVAYVADKNGEDTFAEGVTFRGNTVTCGSGPCVLIQTPDFGSGQGAVVTDNTIEELVDGQGIQVEGYRDVIIARNILHAPDLGNYGIDVHAARGVTVIDNVVTGPWRRGLALRDGTTAARAEHNTFDPATVYTVTFEFADSITFAGNAVACGVACVLSHVTNWVTIADNDFTSDGSVTGVHVQGGGTDTRILRNRIAATAPSTNAAFGAIRVGRGTGHLIDGNEITGPWANGLSLGDVEATRVVANRVAGSAMFGGLFLRLRGTTVGSNQIAGAGTAGMLLDQACGNAFVGNAFAGDNPVGLVFESATGANTYVGPKGAVSDNGAFDCDGDGVNDRNVLTGEGTPRIGFSLRDRMPPPAADAVLR